MAFDRQMRQGIAALERGQIDAALGLFLGALEHRPDSPDALQLAGIAARKLGRLNDSITFLRKAIAIAPRQAEYHNSLAGALLESRQYHEAEASIRSALQIRPNYGEAAGNLAILFDARGEGEAARNQAEIALSLQPRQPNVWAVLAKARLKQRDFGGAMAANTEALKLAPRSSSFRQQRAEILQQMARVDEAIQVLREAAALDANAADTWVSLGASLGYAGDFAAAENALRRALAIEPAHARAHEALAELLWQAKSDDLAALRDALNVSPKNGALHRLAGLHCLRTGRLDEAMQYLRHATTVDPSAANFLTLSDGLLQCGLFQDALAASQSAAGAPEQSGVRSADALLKLGRYDEAALTCERLARDFPESQSVLARWSTSLKMVERKDTYDWLASADTLVKTFQMPAPAGYADMADFLAVLKQKLLAQHRSQRQPSDQSLRNGTQSLGQLLGHAQSDPDLAALEQAFFACVRAYIADAPVADDHPFLRRRAPQVALAGSWSNRLSPGGFHVNHIHPQGWISSAFYVDLPPEEPDGGGDLQFGESYLTLGAADRPQMLVRPRPGMLVLFPSYFWHGTTPVTNGTRLAVAFDVIPQR